MAKGSIKTLRILRALVRGAAAAALVLKHTRLLALTIPHRVLCAAQLRSGLATLLCTAACLPLGSRPRAAAKHALAAAALPCPLAALGLLLLGAAPAAVTIACSTTAAPAASPAAAIASPTSC